MNAIWLSTLQQHLMAGHISRRDFMKRAAALGFSAPVITAALAACGGDETEDEPAGAATTAPGRAATSAGAGTTPTSAITVNQNATATAASGTGSPTSAAAASPTAAATKAATGAAGGSIVLARAVDSERYDPVLTDANVDIWIFMSIYDQLIKVDDKGTGLKPGLAEEWEVSDDGLTYTFHIREGVKFQDGTDMTMDDIIGSLERARTTEESAWTFSLAQVDEITAPDDSTIQIVLTQPWAPFLSDMSLFNASVISQAFVEKVGEEALSSQCMGTGPFGLAEWRKAEYTQLVKNEDYWEEGLPLLDEIRFTVVPDTNNEILQLQGGEVDGIVGQGDVPFNRIEELKKDPNLQVISSVSTYNNFIVLNTRDAPLNDVNARRALNYATDKGALIDTVLFGNAEISNSFMPNGALYWNPDQEGYPFDLDKAKDAISQSATPEGFELEFQILAESAQQLQIASAIKNMWSAIGVTVNIAPLEATILRDNYRNNLFQARLSGWTNDIIDPDELVSYAILPEATENYHTGWINQEAIDLAHQGQAELDDEKRREIYYEVQRIHMEDAPFVYLYVVPYIDALHKKIKEFFHHPMGHYVFTNTYVEE